MMLPINLANNQVRSHRNSNLRTMLLKRFVLFGVLVFSYLGPNVFGQATSSDSIVIEGIVKPLDLPLKDYRVTISSSGNDSAPEIILFSQMMSTTHFIAKAPLIESPIVLSILYPGAKPWNMDLGIITSKYDIGSIEVEPDTLVAQLLDEVVVSASRPLVQEKGTTTVFNIQGTILSEAGTLRSLIQRLPGFSIQGDKIEVLDAYGIETVILINNQPITNVNLIDVLPANNIKSIEIIRDPDVQYAGKIVIKIDTIKRISDYLYHDIAASYMQGRRAGGDIGTNMILKLGKLQGEVSYQYNDNNQLTDDESFRLMPEDGSQFNLLDKTRTDFRNKEHAFLLNLGYTMSERTQMSLLYNSSFRNAQTIDHTDRSIKIHSNHLQQQLQQKSKSSSQMHSVSLAMTHTTKKQNTLTLLTDYAYVGNKSDYATYEERANSQDNEKVRTKTDSHSYLFNAMGNYAFTALWGSQLNIGAKFNSITMPTTYHYDDVPNTILASLVNDIKTKEQSYKLYVDVKKWLTPRLEVHVGASYDHTSRNVKYLQANNPKEFAIRYDNIIPTFSATYLFSNISFLNIGLTVPFVKPHFEDLVPSMIYKDNLLYQSSEPTTEATKSYVISSMWRYKTFSLRALVTHIPYFYERTYERLNSNSYVMKNTLASFYNQTFSQLTASYVKQWNNGLFIQPILVSYYRPYFINGEVSKYKFTYYPMLTIGYHNRKLYAWTRLSYLNEHSNGIQWVDRTGFSIDAGVTASLFDNTLTVDLSVPNISRTKVPRYYSINGGMKWGVTPIHRDPEYFKLSIRYKLFNKQIRSNKQQGNQEDLNRLL